MARTGHCRRCLDWPLDLAAPGSLSRRQLLVVVFDARGDFVRLFFKHAEITSALHVEPELWALPEKLA